MSQTNQNAVHTALSLSRTFPAPADARLEGEMHSLLSEHPGLAAKPMKLLCAAQVRIGQRDAKSWSKIIEGIAP